MAYLHLFYENYVSDTGSNALSVIKTAKQKIQKNALDKLKIAQLNSYFMEQDFQQLYEIKNSEFTNPEVKENLKQANIIMNDFDAAVARLQNLMAEGKDVTDAIVEGNKIIETIDQMLLKGAQTNTLAEAACEELRSCKQRMQDRVRRLKYYEAHGLPENMRGMLKEFNSDIQSNASGYLLEVAQIFGFLGGSAPVLERMVNIGGHTGVGLRARMKIDPKFKQHYQKIKQALSANGKNVQSHADAVFIRQIDESGNGEVSIVANYTGFQNKNVRDTTSISLRPYALGEVGILDYYSSDFLVNTIGTLAGRRYQITKIPNTLNEEPKYQQKDLNLYWSQIKASTKILGIVDAIGQKIGANISNKINFYVIRSKNSGQIRVIPVSEILEQIRKGYEEINESKIGVNDDSTVESDRSKYIRANVTEFSFNRTPEQRSNIAYTNVLELILQTKITISLNMSQWIV